MSALRRVQDDNGVVFISVVDLIKLLRKTQLDVVEPIIRILEKANEEGKE